MEEEEEETEKKKRLATVKTECLGKLTAAHLTDKSQGGQT